MGRPACNNFSAVCVCVCVFDSTGQFLGCTRNSHSTDFKNKGRNPEPFCENSQGKLFPRLPVPFLSSFFSKMCFLRNLGAALLWAQQAVGCDLTSQAGAAARPAWLPARPPRPSAP